MNKSNDNNDQIIFCRKCGNKLLPDSVFCEKCGTKVVTNNSVESDNNITYRNDTQEFSSKHSKTKAVLIVSVIVSILIIGSAVFFLRNNNQPEVRDKESTSVSEHSSTYKETSKPETYSHSTERLVTQESRTYVTTRKVVPNTSELIKNTCSSSGCDNIIDDFEDYCPEHKCAENNCDNEKDLLSSYCYYHKCSASRCENGKYKTGNYCIEHTCNEEYCNDKKEINSDYCFMHGCREPNCKNGAADHGRYCAEHTCAERNCSDSKSIGSEFCFLHKCNYGGCDNGRSGYGFYCSEHTCIKSGCSNQKSITSDYCLSHD